MANSRVYDKLNWHIFGNGDVNVSYLSRQISRAILRSCQAEYKTIEEISDLTGMPCMYIEDELNELVRGEIVFRKGNRYIAGVILYSGAYLKTVNSILKTCAPEIMFELSRAMQNNIDDIRAIGFIGCDAKQDRMGWWLAPVFMRAACDRARELIGFERGDFYPRLDGGKGWLVAYENAENVRRYYAGCNNYYLDNSRFRYFWTDKYLNTELVALLRLMEDRAVSLDDPVLAAECVRCGIAEIKDGRAGLTIPVFSEAQYALLNAVVAHSIEVVAERLVPAAERLLKVMKANAPVHLHDQIQGLFGVDFNAIIAVICDLMEQEKLLERPRSHIFAAQVVMIQ